MNIFVAGIGPGNYDLITLSALEHASRSDLIIVPRSDMNTMGMSEKVIRHYVKDKFILPVHFPMIKDENECIRVIHEQLMHHQWEGRENIFFPVIGDSVLYSTGYYFVRAFEKIIADINIEFIPGISAHSLASSMAKKYLAMRDEIFTVIPGTSEPERITAAMRASDVIAIYKPKAVKNLRELVMKAGEFKNIIRIDYAGIQDKESIHEGLEALNEIHEYMSIILLWR
ncbi:MAG: precorrin-2 C(20)-methyltransferase [Synergistaceae bacterium]|nr:precorrin-2 C(20)-methyltransferase [Synergistaceae bacterium]